MNTSREARSKTQGRWTLAVLFLPIVLIAGMASAQNILWEQDCLGLVKLTQIPGGEHVVCEELLPTPTASEETPTPTLTNTPEPSATATSTPASSSNDLVNPCFSGPNNGDPVDWEQTEGWDVSFGKNPCEDGGYAGRINDPSSNGESAPFQDERIYQVVFGGGSYLTAEINCVQRYAAYVDANIYGSQDGVEWLLVWTPFTLETCTWNVWSGIQHSEIQLAEQFTYYKFEVNAMYTSENGAVKVTSALFTSR